MIQFELFQRTSWLGSTDKQKFLVFL